MNGLKNKRKIGKENMKKIKTNFWENSKNIKNSITRVSKCLLRSSWMSLIED